MTRLSTFKGQGRATVVFYVFGLLLLMLLSACGDGSDSSDIRLDSSSSESAETGSAIFTIQWDDAPTIKGLANALAEETQSCENVETITCKVYDESNDHLVTGDTWPCSAHTGRIDGIPVGQNRKFVILGGDAEGNIVYQGQKPDINIEARPDNDAGTIEAHSFVPEGLKVPAVSASQIALSWDAPNANVSFAGYRIYRDGVEAGESASLSFNDTGLTQNTQYCYTVSTYDAFGNESRPSNQDCATTEVSDDKEPPTVPTNLRAQASSASQIDLSWTASSDNVGVTGYWIYRDGDRVGTSASPPYSDTGLTQNTEYCYTVEAYDAAGNESGLSGQDCEPTMESFDWYRDSDNDNHGDPNDSINSETQPEGYVSDNADCNDDDPSIHPGATEACNGDDDDCDGSVDEGLTRPTTCGVGDCADNSGTETCVAGVWGNDTCDPFAGAILEVCDGLDNDCDGSADEGIDPVPTTCGIGQCTSSGERACIGGQLVDSCQTGTPEEEVCDGMDNDCDGSTDEGIDPVPTTCGIGQCASSGQLACIGGQLVNSCQPGTPKIEECDGLDNDCDGDVDNGLSFNYYYWDDDEDDYGDPDNRTWDCVMPPGYVANNLDCDDYDPYINPGEAEICNDSIDQDCDGFVDEGCPIFDIVGDKDGFGLGMKEGDERSVSAGFFDNREIDDPPFTDRIPAGDTEFSYEHDFNPSQEILNMSAALRFFTLGIQDGDNQVYGSDSDIKLFIDNVEILNAFDEVDQFDYNYNSSEWVEIAGLVTIPIPYSLLYLLTDGNIVVRFETLQYGKIGSIDAYSIDYSELIIDYEE